MSLISRVSAVGRDGVLLVARDSVRVGCHDHTVNAFSDIAVGPRSSSVLESTPALDSAEPTHSPLVITHYVHSHSRTLMAGGGDVVA